MMGHLLFQPQISHSDRSPWNQRWSLTMATASSLHLTQEDIGNSPKTHWGRWTLFPRSKYSSACTLEQLSTLLLAQSTSKGYAVPEHDHGRITGPRHHLPFRISTQCWMYRFVSFIKIHSMCLAFRYRNVWGCLLH